MDEKSRIKESKLTPSEKAKASAEVDANKEKYVLPGVKSIGKGDAERVVDHVREKHAAVAIRLKRKRQREGKE